MKLGAIVPQGWTGEYDGRDPAEAWSRTVAVARHAERLGFESIWLFDHFHTVPKPTDEITFESWVSLSALAAHTQRVRLGHIVIADSVNPLMVTRDTWLQIAAEVMDTGVNCGPDPAARMLQRLLNASNDSGRLWADLKVDGKCGPATSGALVRMRAASGTGPRGLRSQLMAARPRRP